MLVTTIPLVIVHTLSADTAAQTRWCVGNVHLCERLNLQPTFLEPACQPAWPMLWQMYKFYDACPTSLPLGNDGESTFGDEQPASQTMLTDIRILTDGTCGSTCSQFVSRPYLTGAATLYTYGGFEDEKLDISSFNAGNVTLL